MLLAIDAGNTNLVFALVEGGQIKARWRIATDPRRTADQYSVWLHQLLELEGFSRDDVDGVIIGTVVPRALHNLEVLSREIFPRRADDRRAGRGGVADASSTSTSRRASGPTGRSMRLPPMPSIRATCWSSTSEPRRHSTWSARRAPT